MLSPKIGNKVRMSIFRTLFSVILEILASVRRQRKKKAWKQEKEKPDSLFSDDMIVYMESSKESPKT